MRVIYKKEFRVSTTAGGHKLAAFTVGKVYDVRQAGPYMDKGDFLITDENGFNHYFSLDWLFQHFDLEPEKKRMTVSVAHQLVALDVELGCMQAELDNLKERMAERQAALDSLIDEYGVEDL